MKGFNELLSSNPQLVAALQDSTQRYVASRNELWDLGRSSHPGGGPERIKCLHAHVAHFLATNDNPVGARVIQHLQWHEPAVACIEID